VCFKDHDRRAVVRGCSVPVAPYAVDDKPGLAQLLFDELVFSEGEGELFCDLFAGVF
jgi:hypothetical protein